MVKIIDERREELADLCRKHHVNRLEVFGSAARADFGRGSDIDLLVEFNEDIGSIRFDNFFELQRKLAELFGRPVDLVEPGGLRNPYFIRRVNETREPIYVSS
jgi:predicted nucleotidyltransferase